MTMMRYALFSLILILSSAADAAPPRLVSTNFGLVDEDVSYSSLYRNSMDLYIPHQLDFTAMGTEQEDFHLKETAASPKRFPVILFIHGGSFVAGDRKEFPYAQIGVAFQRQGIICAVMSYRLMKDSLWPAQPRDVARAVRWLKENVSQYGGDPDRIYIVGHSAGGHLAALVSTDSTYMNETGLSLKDIAGTVAIGAMMSDGGSLASLTAAEEYRLFRTDWFFKIFGSKENFANSLPLRHVNPFMPKMLLILADSERFDPPKEASVKEFIERADRASVSVQYFVLNDRTHMGTVEHMTNPSDPAVRTILSFIAEQESHVIQTDYSY